MSIQLGSAYGKVSVDASGVNAGVDSAVKSMQTLQTKMMAIGQTMSNIGAKMTLGLTVPLGLFAKSAINSSNQSQDAIANLKATIESTGGAAGVTAEKAIELATAFQKTTKFSDEAIINGQAMLLTFTKIGSDVFPMATEAMLNMGQKFGSVENASIQLGKALNDPITGVTALRRVGVMLTDEQENQIKKFMAVNDIAAAQKVILKELETEFGGLAVAMGKTDSGKIEQFKNALDDLKELFGDRLKKSLIPFLESMTKAINGFLALPEPVKNAITDMVINIGKIIFVAGPIMFVIGKLITFASLFLPGGAMAGVGTFITASLLPAISQFFTYITATAIPAIAAFVIANSWWIAPLLLVAGTVYLVYKAFETNFMGITTTAKQLWFIIKWTFGQIGNIIITFFNYFKAIIETNGDYMNDWIMGIPAGLRSLVMFFGQAFAAIQGIFNYFMSILRTNGDYMNDWIMSVPEKLRPMVMFFGKIFGNIIDVISKTFNKIKSMNWSDVGKYIMLGLANGILGGIPAIIAAAAQAGQAALEAMRKALDSHSPSRKFMKLGIDSGDGYKLGLLNSVNPNTVAKMMAKPVQGMTNSNQQINMQFAHGVTFHQVRSMLAENNDKLLMQLNNALGG